jgi:hypothetical protein
MASRLYFEILTKIIIFEKLHPPDKFYIILSLDTIGAFGTIKKFELWKIWQEMEMNIIMAISLLITPLNY